MVCDSRRLIGYDEHDFSIGYTHWTGGTTAEFKNGGVHHGIFQSILKQSQNTLAPFQLGKNAPLPLLASAAQANKERNDC